MEFSKRNVNILLALFTAVFAAGTVLGSVYLMRSGAVADADFTGYLGAYMTNAQGGIDRAAAIKKSFFANLPYFAMLFISGFFRKGWLLSGFAIVKKGFVTGFTAAACVKVFGFFGVTVTAAMLPEMLLMMPSAVVFSSISTDFALNFEKRKKNFLFFYIFLSLIMLTTFCAAALCEGYLTTTFMRWLSPKIMK